MAKRFVYYPFIVLIVALAFSACQNKNDKAYEAYKKEIEKSRHEGDLFMLTQGIIEPQDTVNYKGLNYFDVDTNFRIKARIKELPPLPVEFKTNTERSPLYYVFCLLEFNVGDSLCTLIAYSETDKDVKQLFIPFKDASGNIESYGGGRYLDLEYKGEKDFLTLDFNKAYNPYCHYNHSYSCPLVPEQNRLKVSIKAGEKKFHE